MVADWKSRSEPDYLEEVLTGGDGEPFLQLDSNSDAEQEDVLYDEAVEFGLPNGMPVGGAFGLIRTN